MGGYAPPGYMRLCTTRVCAQRWATPGYVHNGELHPGYMGGYAPPGMGGYAPPGYGRGGHEAHSVPGDHAGCVPGDHAGCVTRVSWWVYTFPTMVGIHSLPTMPLHHPGYTHHPTVHLPVCASAPAHAEVSREESPGSEREKPMGESLSGRLKAVKVWWEKGLSAQSYSALPA